MTRWEVLGEEKSKLPLKTVELLNEESYGFISD
jgi:hypothetical protein